MTRIINFFLTVREIFKLNIKNIFEYRFQLYSQLFILPTKILVVYLLWSQILKNQTGNTTITIKWIFLYYVILAFFEFVTMPFCVIAYYLMSDVRDGALDIFLVRPFPYLIYRYLGQSSNLLTLILGSAILNIILGIYPWQLKFYVVIYYFCLSTILLFILFSFIGVCSFLVENVLTLRDNMWNIIKIFSGAIIPLSLYPKLLRDIVDYLPFKYIYYVPINSMISGNNVDYLDLYLSLIYLVVLATLLAIVWKVTIKNYSSQGG